MDTGDVRAKFEAFGWDAVEIDGHDMDAIVEALERSRTLRPPGGDRLPDQEGPRRLLHGGPLRLPRQAAQPGAGRARRWRSSRRRSSEQTQGAAGRCERPDRAPPRPQTEPIATRQAYGDALVELGERHDDVVALDADLAVSTQSIEVRQAVPGALLQLSARPRRT